MKRCPKCQTEVISDGAPACPRCHHSLAEVAAVAADEPPAGQSVSAEVVQAEAARDHRIISVCGLVGTRAFVVLNVTTGAVPGGMIGGGLGGVLGALVGIAINSMRRK